MIKKYVNINNFDRVKEFVNATCSAPFDVDLASGRYIIDAKSIMGVFSLNLSNVLELDIHSDENVDTDRYLKSIEAFLV